MEAIDRLNHKHGRQTVRFGLPQKREKVNWQMSRNYLSPGYTTNLIELLRIGLKKEKAVQNL